MARKKRDTRREKVGEAIRSHLETLSKKQLVERLYQFATSDQDVWDELESECECQPQADSHKELIRWTEDAIRDATEPGLEWGGDYPKVREHLKQLADRGQVAAVLELGAQLLQRGREQIELSDEGLMTDDLADCMKVVFSVLPKSSLEPAEQMQWVFDRSCEDGYCMTDAAAAKFWRRRFKRADWGKFADALCRELDTPTKQKRRMTIEEGFRRQTVVTKAVEALKQAGRDNEAVELLQHPKA